MGNQSGFSPSGQSAGFQNNVVPQDLPNARLVLITGILSILFCWWHFISVAGIILALISILVAQREKTRYYANPSGYSISSYNNVRTGRTCAIIGLCISLIIFTFVILLLFGILVTLPFWGMIQ